MILILNVHYTRAGDLIHADNMLTDPWVPLTLYRDWIVQTAKQWGSVLAAP